MARLPQPGGDKGSWGEVLNDFLGQVHEANGTLKDGSVQESTLSSSVQTKLNAPSTIADDSITKTKLVTSVQTSLDKADTALQTAPVTSVNTATGDVVLTKTDIGLGAVDNTSDANKPLSAPQAQAIDDILNTHTPGAQIGYAERLTPFTTTNNSFYGPVGDVGGLTLTITGTGRAVDIEFVCPAVSNSDGTSPVSVSFIVNDNPLSAQSQIFTIRTAATVSSEGTPVILKRSAVLSNGVDYTFIVRVVTLAAGTCQIYAANPYQPMSLAVTAR